MVTARVRSRPNVYTAMSIRNKVAPMSSSGDLTSDRAKAVMREIESALARKPRTPRQLAKRLDLSLGRTRRYLRELSKLSRVHVTEWVRHNKKGARWEPLYDVGSKPDAPRPRPISPHAVVQAYRERARVDPKRYPGYHRAIRRTAERNRRLNQLALLKNIDDPMARMAVANGMADARQFTRTVTPEVVDQIVALRESGMTYQSIAFELGISRDTASHHYRKRKEQEQCTTE